MRRRPVQLGLLRQPTAILVNLANQSQSHFTADSQSVLCLGVEPTLWTFDQILLPFQEFGSGICCLVSVGRPLWREAGSVLCKSRSSHLSVCTFTKTELVQSKIPVRTSQETHYVSAEERNRLKIQIQCVCVSKIQVFLILKPVVRTLTAMLWREAVYAVSLLSLHDLSWLISRALGPSNLQKSFAVRCCLPIVIWFRLQF
jgi:hypothetical protein